MTIKDIVREGTRAYFSRYVHGSEGATFYYNVRVNPLGVGGAVDGEQYEFPTPASEIENTTIQFAERAITLMR